MSLRFRRLRPLLVSIVACCLLWPASSSASSPGDTLGVYRGSSAAARVAEWETWIGRPAYRVVDFLERSSWDKIEAPTWWVANWQASAYRDRIVYSVPMLPDTHSSLARGATGAYDEHFARLARLLVARGQGGSTIRLGWEFNGDWYRWNAALDPDGFVAYWRRIVTAMRAQPGAHFRFDWCPNDGRGTIAPDRVYPGDEYVDVIGSDVYDHGWAPGYQDPDARWREIRDQPYGLAWQREFAAAHGKPTSFPEWGVVRSDHGGGDSPEFIRRMHDWIAAGDVEYSAYFEADIDTPMRLMTGTFPRAAEEFRRLFGGPGVGGGGGAGAGDPAPPSGTTGPGQSDAAQRVAAKRHAAKKAAARRRAKALAARGKAAQRRAARCKAAKRKAGSRKAAKRRAAKCRALRRKASKR